MSDARMLAACIQLTSGADVGENLTTCARLCADAAARGAKLAVLPENFAFVGGGEQEKFAFAERLDGAPGPILTALGRIARDHGLWLIAGGMPEAGDDKTKVWNTCVAIDPQGKLVARYRKIHLFDINIPNGAVFEESRTVTPGRDVVTVETPWAKVGLSICYDVRFPELYRALGAAGSRVIVVPAAFTLHTGKDHWHALLRARAIENQVYILAAAQYGRHNDKRTTYGHSLVIDPWGTIVAEGPDRACAVVAELDFAFQDKVRTELPCLTHRRL